MRRLLLALACALGCGASMRPVDVVGQAAFTAVILADFGQTKAAIGREGLYEGNPILGRDGERVPPAVYFASILVLHAAVAALLPSTWRTMWQGGAIGIEARQIVGNYGKVGLGWEPAP